MKFLRNLLAVLLGLFIFTFIAFFLLIGVVSISSTDQTVTISKNTMLHLVISGNIVEREIEDPFSDIGILGSGSRLIGLKEIKEAIRQAKTDDAINGIFLEPKIFMGGMASIEEIRDEIKSFKESGKFVVSYSEYYTEKAYYLASVADEIYLTPDFGFLEFNGMSAEYMFFKGTLDKLGVEPQIFRVGDYKGAVEPFIRTDLSKENREQIGSYVNSIYDHVLSKIAFERDMTIDELRKISNSMLVREGEDAVTHGLIDGIMYYDQVKQVLREKMGLEADDDIRAVSYKKYNRSYSNSKYSKERIAVIVAEGNIYSGKGENGVIGSDTYAKLIRNARENDRVKAVVIRMNSGGGSALASDIIWKEIKLTTEKKPVVASVADVAASGGYYIVMACDKIIAHPTSITGSIGIFGILFNLEGLLENKLGITTDNVSTGEYSNLFTVSRPLTAFEKDIIQKNVEKGYETFTTKAADDRNMEIDELLKIASGRVWSGAEAKELGLLDEFGSLEDAITSAAEMADISDYSVSYYPIQKTLLEQVMSDLGADVHAKMLKLKTGNLYPYIEKVEELTKYNGIQARMPFDIEIN